MGVGVGVGAANTSFVTPNSAPRSSVELTGILPVITAPAAMASTKKVLLPTIFPERSIMRTEMLPENNVSASVVLEIVTSTQDEDSLTVVSTEIPATGSPLRGKVCIAAVGLGDGVAEVSLPPQAARGVSIRQQRKIVSNFFMAVRCNAGVLRPAGRGNLSGHKCLLADISFPFCFHRE